MKAAIQALARALQAAQCDALDAAIVLDEAKTALQAIAAHNYAATTLNDLRISRSDATCISTTVPYAIRQSYAAALSHAIEMVEKEALAEKIKELVWDASLQAIASGDTEMLAIIDKHFDTYLAAHHTRA